MINLPLPETIARHSTKPPNAHERARVPKNYRPIWKAKGLCVRGPGHGDSRHSVCRLSR